MIKSSESEKFPFSLIAIIYFLLTLTFPKHRKITFIYRYIFLFLRLDFFEQLLQKTNISF